MTKADTGQIKLKFEPLQLNDIDRHRLRKLLLNLVDNANKCGQPDGLAQITLASGGACGELVVLDSRPGMPLAVTGEAIG